MATLASVSAGGNFNTAATWNLCANGANANQLESATGINSGTVYGTSNLFTIGAGEVCDAVCVVMHRLAGATGSVDIALSEDSGTSWFRVCSLSVALFPDTPTYAWIVFSSTFTGLGTNTYRVGLRTSVSNTMTFRSNGSSNWFRAIRRTTVSGAAPVAGDVMIIAADVSSAAPSFTTPGTVTMDNTAATLFGTFGLGAALVVGKNGKLSYGIAASTNYQLKLQGHVYGGEGSTIEVGTPSNPIPATSTALFQIHQNATDNQYNLNSYGTFTAQGVSMGKEMRCMLAADSAAAATSLTTSIATGWKAADIYSIAATARTSNQHEQRTLAVDAAGTTITTPALTHAHSGTSPIAAEMMLLTRNVKIWGHSATLRSGYVFQAKSVVDFDYVEFKWLKLLETRADDTVGGSYNMANCGFHEMQSDGYLVNSAALGPVATLNNFGNTPNSYAASLAGTRYTFSDNWINSFQQVNVSNSTLAVFTNNRHSGANQQSFAIAFNSGNYIGATFSGNRARASGQTGFDITVASTQNLRFLNNVGLRCVNYGLQLGGGSSYNDLTGTVIENFEGFGNGTANIQLNMTVPTFGLTLKGCVFNGGTTLVAPRGVQFVSACRLIKFRMIDCDFGVTTAHTTADLQFLGTNNNEFVDFVMFGTKLNSATEITGYTTALRPHEIIGSMDHDRVVGSHRAWKKYGILESDSSIFKSAAPSEKLIPNNATNKLQHEGKKVPVKAANTLAISVWVREVVIGEGVDYNGNRARLVLLANPSAGIPADVVMDSASATSEGGWEEIGGTTPAVSTNSVLDFRVDVDGTTGYVWVDDWTIVV